MGGASELEWRTPPASLLDRINRIVGLDTSLGGVRPRHALHRECEALLTGNAPVLVYRFLYQTTASGSLPFYDCIEHVLVKLDRGEQCRR